MSYDSCEQNLVNENSKLYSIENKFNQAIRDVKNTKLDLSDEEKLKLYGLYKQSLFGDNNTELPWFFYYNSRNKWLAWKREKGKRKIEAKKDYYNYVEELKRKINTKTKFII